MPDLPKIHYVNDLHRSNKQETSETINRQARLSVSYAILLLTSTIICTFGLLLDSAPVVIGAMIIAPLMWPLLRVGLAITKADTTHLFRGIWMLISSTLFVLMIAAVLTYFSPIKNLTTEVLSRTEPTLLDLIIALASGLVATIGVSHPKISNSMSGVAVATSLMPPICVSGIGLALVRFDIFSGGLLLFVTNILAIVFMAVVTFLLTGFGPKTKQNFSFKTLVVLAVALVLTSIPLISILRSQSFQTDAYSQAQTVLRKELRLIHPEIFIENLKTSPNTNDSEVYVVSAEVWIPEDVNISFVEQQKLRSELSRTMGREIDLKLRLQQTISILSEEVSLQERTRALLSEITLEQIEEKFPSAKVDSISVTSDTGWTVSVVLRGDPTERAHQEDVQEIAAEIRNQTGKSVAVELDFVPRLQLYSRDTELADTIRNDVLEFLDDQVYSIEIVDLSFEKQSENDQVNSAQVVARASLLPFQSLSSRTVQELEVELLTKYNIPIEVTIETISISVIE